MMNKLITTVTLNAAIDKTYWIPGFTVGTVNRTARMNTTPGGKGLNAARVIQQLGHEVMASGVVGGWNGQHILSMLDALDLSHKFHSVRGESRICLNIIDDADQSIQSTEILEQGLTIDAADLDQMGAIVEELAARSAIIAFSGSLPAGAPIDWYARLINSASKRGATVYLDTSGQALHKSLLAKPAFIKPNEDEIGVLLGIDQPTESDIQAGVLSLMEQGIRTVAVTLGGDGAIAGHEGQLYRVTAPRVQAVNTVGCGDAFVGGMAVAEARGLSIEERLAYATAVATASAMTEETGGLRLADLDVLLPQVKVAAL